MILLSLGGWIVSWPTSFPGITDLAGVLYQRGPCFALPPLITPQPATLNPVSPKDIKNHLLHTTLHFLPSSASWLPDYKTRPLTSSIAPSNLLPNFYPAGRGRFKTYLKKKKATCLKACRNQPMQTPPFHPRIPPNIDLLALQTHQISSASKPLHTLFPLPIFGPRSAQLWQISSMSLSLKKYSKPLNFRVVCYTALLWQQLTDAASTIPFFLIKVHGFLFSETSSSQSPWPRLWWGWCHIQLQRWPIRAFHPSGQRDWVRLQ